VPKKQILPADEAVHVSLGVQLLAFHEAEPLSSHSWAGAEEILQTVDLSAHPNSASTLQFLLECGWESDSVTGLLLGVWMKKAATAGEVAADLLCLSIQQRRALTALYSASNNNTVVQYSVTREGTLMQHVYSRQSLATPDIKLYLS
jgi:hypothetical protein